MYSTYICTSVSNQPHAVPRDSHVGSGTPLQRHHVEPLN